MKSIIFSLSRDKCVTRTRMKHGEVGGEELRSRELRSTHISPHGYYSVGNEHMLNFFDYQIDRIITDPSNDKIVKLRVF